MPPGTVISPRKNSNWRKKVGFKKTIAHVIYMYPTRQHSSRSRNLNQTPVSAFTIRDLKPGDCCVDGVSVATKGASHAE
jgi:hypothetical protein